MSWTEERVATLAKLWADGLSASQIAAELGGVTRNAVIGKVHRLGLSGRVKSNAPANRAKRPQKPAQPRAAKLPVSKSGNLVTLRVNASMTLPREPVVDLVAPQSLQLNLEDLSEITCKWPSGDPALPEFSFCGVRTQVDGPYCEYHSRLAYQPMADRRRARRIMGS